MAFPELYEAMAVSKIDIIMGISCAFVGIYTSTHPIVIFYSFSFMSAAIVANEALTDSI